MKWKLGMAISIALLIALAGIVSACNNWCTNPSPINFPSGVAAGSSVTLNGPTGTEPYNYAWTVIYHTSNTVFTTQSLTGQSITFNVPTGTQRVDVKLIVSNANDYSCQIQICDWFWVNYLCPLKDMEFCEDKRVDGVYDYSGPLGGMGVLYTVTGSQGLVEFGWWDPFTAHFTDSVKYPVGTYRVCFYLYGYKITSGGMSLMGEGDSSAECGCEGYAEGEAVPGVDPANVVVTAGEMLRGTTSTFPCPINWCCKTVKIFEKPDGQISIRA